MRRLLKGIDLFLVTFLTAKYTDIITVTSARNNSLFLVYFLILPFRFPISLVVFLKDSLRALFDFWQLLYKRKVGSEKLSL